MRIVFWFAIGCLLPFFLVACARPSAEQRLRDEIARVEAAIQQREAADLTDTIAPDFGGPEGLDREGAKRLATAMFLRYPDINVQTGPLDVQLQGSQRASVRFTATLSGGNGALLPQSAQLYQVTTGWRMQNGRWQLVNAQWQPKL